MGLDVYLHKYSNFEATRAYQQAECEFEEAAWKEAGEYDSLTDEQKNAIRDKIKKWKEEHPEDPANTEETIELNSAVDPGNMFKIGYFRSSYNSGGINHILREQVGKDLYYIFPHKDSEYYLQPDWADSRRRAEEVLREWRIKLATEPVVQVVQARYNEFGGAPDKQEVNSAEVALAKFQEEVERYKDRTPLTGPFKVVMVSMSKMNPFHSVTDDSEAREAYVETVRSGMKLCEDDVIFEKAVNVRGILSGVRDATEEEQVRWGSTKIPCTYYVIDEGEIGEYTPAGGWDSGAYGNRNGEFWVGKPLKVVGIINGIQQRFFVDEKLPCTYAIAECDHKYEWYQTALEIVIETCEYVLQQPDADKYYLHWSG